MSYALTIDASGITGKTYDEILAQLQSDFRSIYGADVYIEPDSKDGQWLGILAQAFKDISDLAIAVFNNQSPSFAQGNALASLVKLNGLRSLTATYSQVVVNLIGQAGLVINDGAVRDTGTGTRWLLPATVIIPNTGEINVTATATVAGAINAAPNTVTNIDTPVPGWQTVNNAAPAIPGNPVETDAQLRRRQAKSTALPAITPRESIAAAIANVTDVVRSKVFENSSSVSDANGLPAHSIAVVVQGGQLSDVATVITLKKAPGTTTFGTVSEIIFDSSGVPNTVSLSPLVLVPIYYKVTITPLDGFTSNTENMILSALSQYFNSLDIGDDVLINRLWSPVNLSGTAAKIATGLSQENLDTLSETYEVENVLVGTDADHLSAANISIQFNKAAQGLTANGLIIVQAS